MEIILAGYFETALVRFSDEFIQPNRNQTTHPYYMCVNRKVSKNYFDRAATFIALAQHTIVPMIDWGPFRDEIEQSDFSPRALSISVNDDRRYGAIERDADTTTLCNILLDSRALSPKSWHHVSDFQIDSFPPEAQPELRQRQKELKSTIAHHYLCRLILQIRASANSGATLVISENDIGVLSDIRNFLVSQNLPTPYALPDIQSQMFDGDNFMCGVLNFSPPDILALAAVKQDRTIKKYAERLSVDLRDLNTEATQRRILGAMKDAHDESESVRASEKMFEVVGVALKPIRLVPGVETALSLAESAKEMVDLWAKRQLEEKEWYLLGPRMADIAIKDYFSRKNNSF